MAKQDNTPQTGSNAADKSQLQDFVGLPLRDLIVEPLVASSKGQEDLAKVTLDFINDLGFSDDGNGNKQLRTVDIEVPRLVQGRQEPLMQKVSMPLLAMATIPNLAVDSINIDFTIQVQSQTKDENTTDNSETKTNTTKDTNTNTAKVSGNEWFASASDENKNELELSRTITGKVDAKSSHSRTTDFSAKYDINVHASQQRPSEGMSKLMQIIASCIEPVNLSNSK